MFQCVLIFAKNVKNPKCTEGISVGKRPLEVEPMNREHRIADSPEELLELSLPTPLVRLRRSSLDGAPAWAKLEYFNPYSNSVKDRPAYKMLKDLASKGGSGGIIMEASSGNFALALVLLANMMGLRTHIFLPKPTPQSTEVILRFVGAEVTRTDFETIGPDMVEHVKNLASSRGALNLNQFENDLNLEMHLETTAVEIIEQTRAAGFTPDYIVAGIGTSGTIAAIVKKVREELGERVRVIGVVPAPGEKIPGIKRLETNPKWVKEYPPDEVIEITRREALEGMRAVASLDGIPIGMSSGAVYEAYRRLASTSRGNYVLVFPDNIYKYVEALRSLL